MAMATPAEPIALRFPLRTLRRYSPPPWGDDDRALPRGLAEPLGRDLPESTLVTLPDGAPFAALDQPELLAELIGGQVTAHLAAR